MLSFDLCMQSVREPYRDWAEAQIQRIKSVLDGSRSEHTQAVKDRIKSVEQMKDVVSITEGLFSLSKVTISLVEYGVDDLIWNKLRKVQGLKLMHS